MKRRALGKALIQQPLWRTRTERQKKRYHRPSSKREQVTE